MKNLRKLGAILVLIAILLTSAVSVAWAKEAPVEGKKYADSNTHEADKPTFKASGWNTKVTLRKEKSADKSADDVKLTGKPSSVKIGAACKDSPKVAVCRYRSFICPSRKITFNRAPKLRRVDPHRRRRAEQARKRRW